MIKKILYLLFSYSPLPYLVRFLVEIRRPRFFVQLIIKKYFIRKLKVNISEIEFPVEDYQTVLDFFTRRLKSNARSRIRNSQVILSPVDGLVMNYGQIKDGKLIQIKNINYSLSELVGRDTAERFNEGDYITLYLSPRDYHRIHHPVGGHVNKVISYSGRLLPVNRFSLENFREVFSRNRRVVVCYNTEERTEEKNSKKSKDYKNRKSHKAETLPCLSCWVGALNVGKMRIYFDEDFYQKAVKKKHDSRDFLSRSYPVKPIEQGNEAGCFELGSTVILIFPHHSIRWVPTVYNKTFFRVGEPIAKILSKTV